jgi:hypothetical protein
MGICLLLLAHPGRVFPAFQVVVRHAQIGKGGSFGGFRIAETVAALKKQIPHHRPHKPGPGSG